jgi:prevent-host-death family protein
MRKTTITEARRNFSKTLDRALRGDRMVLHRRGQPAAAIVPIEDLELIERYEDELDIRAARQARREKGRIPWEQIKKELNL